MFNPVSKSFEFGGQEVRLETGKIARQATGAVLVKMGAVQGLTTVVGRKQANPGQAFFPLTVNYQEKTYAVGKIPGGFFKREGRPNEKETLTSRLIDRPIRPLFPDGFMNEVQVVCTVVSTDKDQDPDIAASYAGSYMSIGRFDYWHRDGRPKSETLDVALALENIMQSDLTHPGVLHLHIHLIEASLEPERALTSADALEATVPIAGHVVHMPSHIYVRVGQYGKAIDSNLRSQLVDQEFAKLWGDKPLPNLGTCPLSHKIHAGHAQDFVRYAATVQGNYKTAIEAAWAMSNRIQGDASRARGGQKRVAAPWLVLKIFGKWDELIGLDRKHKGTPYLDGMWSYSLGSAHLGKGEIKSALKELAKLQAIASHPDADQYRVGATPASSVLKLAALGLEGEIALVRGDLESAIEAFESGITIEDQNNYTAPPDWAQPMRHYLGATLLKAGLAERAEAVYRRDLRWNQNNGWSLFGLYQALEAQGKKAEAGKVYKAWELAWQAADIKLTASHL